MSLLGVTDDAMRLSSRLIKSRHGIYYFRLQQGGVDKRWSLGTRDPKAAALAAYRLGATISSMDIDPTKIKGWTLKTDGKTVEITTENNDADRASAKELVASLLMSKASSSNTTETPLIPINRTCTVTLSEAIKEYIPVLEQSLTASKSKRMAASVLNNLVKLLGHDFLMVLLNDAVIEEQWLPERLKEVARTTAKRDLSFIRNFVAWAADKKRQYSPAMLTFAITAKGVNYDYFNKDDLKLIFDNLPKHAETAWQFWIVVLGLYTGARIGELASLKTEYVFEKSRQKVIRLAGTKTDNSDRTIPLHPDLIEIGFLDFVQSRRKPGREMLFDLTVSKQNGAGAKASKFFTDFKSKIGIKEPLKVFHSFRHTITDLMNQAGVNEKAGAQYTGHAGSEDVRNRVYGRKPLSIEVMQSEVVNKIDWKKYCGWRPDIDLLKIKANSFI